MSNKTKLDLSDLIDIWIKEQGYNLERDKPFSVEGNVTWMIPNSTRWVFIVNDAIRFPAKTWPETKTNLNPADPEFFKKLKILLDKEIKRQDEIKKEESEYHTRRFRS